MIDENKGQGALGSCRVLDLTQGGYLICGLLFAQMGADVIKIEPPGGDPTRKLGPFYHDIPDPEKSLFWFAYNTDKRSITLNVESTDGQQIFKKLVKTADFVAESFPAGYMKKIGLGYDVLSRVNRGIIMTAMTPFGQAGPYSNYKGPDIVLMAMGGRMYMDGSPDHPPTRISFPQAEFDAGLDAMIGSLVAHHYREETGDGQYIDVCGQTSVSYSIPDVRRYWDLSHIIMKRAGIMRVVASSGVSYRQQWQCQDGYVSYWIIGGALGADSMRALTKWMDEEGMAPPVMKEMDWGGFEFDTATQAQIDAISGPIAKFFMSHTKAEIYEGAIKRRITLLPVNTTKDLWDSPQLADRDYWVELPHAELGDTIIYGGVPVKMARTPLRIEKRAPLIGEHNLEIYHKGLGISKQRLVSLKQSGAI